MKENKGKRGSFLCSRFFSIILIYFFFSSLLHRWFLPSIPFPSLSAFSISTFLWTHQHLPFPFQPQNHEEKGDRETRFCSRFSLCLVSLFRRRDRSFQRAKLCKLFMERQIRRRFSYVRMETAIRVTPVAVFSSIEKRCVRLIFVPLLCFFLLLLFSFLFLLFNNIFDMIFLFIASFFVIFILSMYLFFF